MQTQLPNIFVENNKMMARTDFLKPWKDNPREIDEEDFERLKQRLVGEQFKPLLITSEGIVLGGNMRIRAYKDLRVPKVWVSVISFKKHQDGLVTAYVNNKKDKTFDTVDDAMAHYSFTDNEEFGKYDKQLVAELVQNIGIPLDEYAVHTGKVMTLEEVLAEFAPSGEVDEVDSIADVSKLITCPNCGHEFRV